MTMFKETHEVGFDDDGFAVHKPCGEQLTEQWTITRRETYTLKRNGSTVLVAEDGDDKECDGVWCDACDGLVTMEKEAG